MRRVYINNILINKPTLYIGYQQNFFFFVSVEDTDILKNKISPINMVDNSGVRTGDFASHLP